MFIIKVVNKNTNVKGYISKLRLEKDVEYSTLETTYEDNESIEFGTLAEAQAFSLLASSMSWNGKFFNYEIEKK